VKGIAIAPDRKDTFPGIQMKAFGYSFIDQLLKHILTQETGIARQFWFRKNINGRWFWNINVIMIINVVIDIAALVLVVFCIV